VHLIIIYAEIIDKNCNNRAYADLSHITASVPEPSAPEKKKD